MKKTIKINLSGTIFNIDDDAYDRLKLYLDRISSHFSNKQESKEIIDDIEARIAELFQERVARETEVVSLEIVNEVISIMGNPEDFADSDEDTTHKNYYGSYRHTTKRFYRDPEDAVLGGVCGGLAAYLNIDPLILRLLAIFLLFFGGVTGIVYIVLWIAIPKAETAAQKLEMRGEEVNVSNIEKKIKEEYESVKNNLHNAARSDQAQRTRRAANDFFHALGRIILVFFKAILILIGTAFVISGVGLLIALITGTFLGVQLFPYGPHHYSLGELLTPFTDPLSVTILVISLSLLILIPIAAMIYGLVKLVFQVKSGNRSLAVGATALWFISLIAIIGILAFEGTGYARDASRRSNQDLQINPDTLYVDINKAQEKSLKENALFDLDNEWFYINEDKEFFGQIDLDIKSSEEGTVRLETVKSSKGRSADLAGENAENLMYNYSVKGKHVVFDPYFNIGRDKPWRFPRVKNTLLVPEGTIVVLDKETRDFLHNVENTRYYSDWELGGKTLRMTSRGLEPIEGN
ncbi:MAG: PspC domain-containing protein [Bacteroidota bacterium]